MVQRIGFIGLGAMGKPMAIRLVQAGYEVITCAHRNQVTVQELVQQGARCVDNPAAVAELADIIITMLPDSPEVEEVCFGPDGIVAGKMSERELALVDMSTISPLAARAIGSRLQKVDIDMLDAPVSGGVWRAASGELTIMIGGESEQVERLRTLFEVLGKHVVHVGPLGAGETMKITNNMIVGMLLPALSEALTLAAKAGLRLDTVREVLASSSGDNYILEHWLPKKLFRGDYEAGFNGFALDLMRKDLGLALEVGQALDVPLPEAGLAYQLFTQARGLGYGEQDMTAISKVYQQVANVNILTGQAYAVEA